MANKYVRAGAAGTGSGDDWTNAYTSLPSSLTRGNTYYIADGSYSGYTFDDALSGTSVITVKKATSSDHGTETGWNSAYGDGQADFNGQFLIQTGYLEIDGVTRSGDWWSDYGIKVTDSTPGTFGPIRFSSGSAISNVTLKYLDMQGAGLASVAGGSGSVYIKSSGAISDVLVQACKTANLWPDPFVLQATNATIELCAIDRNYSTEALHGQTIADHGSNNSVFRFSLVYDPVGTAVYTVIGNGQTMDGLKIYGNVIYAPSQRAFPDGISKFVAVITTATVSNAAVHHNTLVNIGWNASISHQDNTGSNRVAYNNLWVNCGDTSHENWTVDYSHYTDTVHDAEANDEEGVSDPLVDGSEGDVRLIENTAAGNTLASPYDTDLTGRTRSTWSRGALEFNAMADLDRKSVV